MQEEPTTLDEMIEQVEQLYQELLDQKFALPLTMTERYRRQKQAGGEPYLQRLQRMREYNRRYYLGTLKQRRRRRRHAAAQQQQQPASSSSSQPAAASQPAANKFMLHL
eukprot:COSAG05_NODE_8257_length_721_cov_2.662379_1_plen_109_part_00